MRAILPLLAIAILPLALAACEDTTDAGPGGTDPAGLDPLDGDDDGADDDSSGDDDDDIGDDDGAGDDDDSFEGDEPGECDDGADNDQDGLFDCDDPNCAGAPACDGDDDDGGDEEGDAAGECDDGADNDLDGLFDCDDPGCDSSAECGGDDDDASDDDDAVPGDLDGDGWPASMDCDDAEPLANPGLQETCGDGIDNDCDGLADCDDEWCSSLTSCVEEDPFEPNDTPSSAFDLTWMAGTHQAVLCEGNDDWFMVCLGEGGSYSATVQDFDNAAYAGPAYDTTEFSGATASGYSMSSHAFGLERGSPAGTCNWYTIELVVVGPTACP